MVTPPRKDNVPEDPHRPSDVMPLTETLRSPQEVPADSIAEELAQLWSDAGAGPEPQDEEGASESSSSTLVRACGLTVIGIAANEDDLARLSPSIGAATVVVPSRTLLVGLCDEVVGGLRAEISAFCSIGGKGNKQVCQEQVILRSTRDRALDLPSLITPLLITDLPAVLVVPDSRLLFSSVVEPLLQAVDLLVVDTRGTEDLRSVTARLVEIRADHPRLAVRDLAYERLLAWREAIADSYDEVLDRHGRLSKVEASCVKGNPEGSLLLGWIESRLQADLKPDVRINNQHEDGERITAIHLEADTPRGPYASRFEQSGRFVVLMHEEDGVSSCDLPRPSPNDVEILIRLLSDPEQDPVYDATLTAVSARYGIFS